MTQHVPCWILKKVWVCLHVPSPEFTSWLTTQLTRLQNERLQEGRHGSVNITLTHHDNDSLAKIIMVIAGDRGDISPELNDRCKYMVAPCHS